MADGNSELGCLPAAIIIGAGIWWVFAGGGLPQVKSWLGMATEDDQIAILASTMKGHKIGFSGDFWLVKGNLGVVDRTALFFGYLDDFTACEEFLTAHAIQYPADIYSCQPAN